MSENRSPLGEFEIRGEWWLPETPTNRVSGVLHYKAGSWVRLEADKPLRDPWVDTEPGIQHFSVALRPFEVMHGNAADGTLCTLLDGAESAGTRIYARCLLTGGHFERAEDVQIRSAEVHLTHLEQWSQHSPFRIALAPSPEQAPYTLDIAYGKKQLAGFEVPSRNCRIEIWSGTIPAVHLFDSADIKHSVLLYVDTTTPQNLSWYRHFFVDCCRLFSFFVGSRVVRTRTACVLATADENRDAPQEVELYDQGLSPDTERERHPITMPLPFPLVAPIAAQVFDKWFSSAEEMAPVYQILLEVLPPNDLGLQSKLLRLAQALEVFYRRGIKGTYVEAETYKRYYGTMLQRLPEDMPGNLKDRLRKHLEYGNEFSLNSVLKRLIKSLDEPAQNALRVEKPTEFASLVANTRNSLTHYSQPDGPVASTAQQYLELTRSLRALLYAVVAKFLGFDTAAVAICIGKALSG